MVLRKLLFKFCLVYIDDILVFSENMNEHIEHLDEIFKRFRGANLKLHTNLQRELNHLLLATPVACSNAS